MAALIAASLTQVIPAAATAARPYVAPASPAGRYCNAVEDYFASGEPGEMTSALVYGWPLLVLGAVGVYGVWKCCKRLLVVAAAASSLLLVLHVTLAFSLPMPRAGSGADGSPPS